jgi:hypothetical protein
LMGHTLYDNTSNSIIIYKYFTSSDTS